MARLRHWAHVHPAPRRFERSDEKVGFSMLRGCGISVSLARLSQRLGVSGAGEKQWHLGLGSGSGQGLGAHVSVEGREDPKLSGKVTLRVFGRTRSQ